MTYAWTRDAVQGNTSGRSWCSRCGALFASAEGFDLHRGIQVRPRREDAQDKGVCAQTNWMPLLGLTAISATIGYQSGWLWYTTADLATKHRMDEVRRKRAQPTVD